jgi:hypothetical protein
LYNLKNLNLEHFPKLGWFWENLPALRKSITVAQGTENSEYKELSDTGLRLRRISGN